MSLFKSNNVNYDSSLFSDMQYEARNGTRSAIEQGRSKLEQAIASDNGHHDQVLDAVNNFSREFFSRIYENAEEISDTDPSWQSAAHDICSQLPEFERLQDLCGDDSDFSALATSQFLTKLEDQIGDLVNEIEDEDKDWDQIVCDYPHIIDKYRGPIRNILDEMSDDIGDCKGIIGNLAGNIMGSSQDKQKLLLDLSKNKKLKEILRRAGKLASICESLPVKSSLCSDDIASLEFGRDIKRTTNGQRSILADPYTQDMFYAKWASHDLELLKMEGKEKLGRGPIHVLLDTSGSMRATLDGQFPAPENEATRNEWAKATAIAMARIAKIEDRSFSVTMFTMGWRDQDQFIHGQYKYAEMINEVATRIYDSGTCFDTLFQKVLTTIKKNEDIILITDGEDYIGNETMEMITSARKEGLRIFTIGVTKLLSPQTDQYSDQVLNIAHLVDEDDIGLALAQTMDNVRTDKT